MDIESHCKSCLAKFGKEFREVHLFLDEFAKVNILEHRKFRHHKEGVEEVRTKFGDRAAEAAELHIIEDWGFVPNKAWYGR